MGIQESLSESARLFGPQIALVEKDNTITYSEFFELVKSIQVELILAGLEAKQVVAVKDDNSIAFAASLYAVMGLGAVALPVYHQVGQNEWDEVLAKANVNWVLANSQWFSNKVKPALVIQNLPFVFFRVHSNLSNWQSVEHPAFIRFTSGTTGQSKGVLLSLNSIWGRIESANRVLNLSSNDTVVWVLPMAFHFVVSIMLYLRYGCKVVLCKSPFPAEIAALLTKEQASFFYASPLHIKLLAQSKVTLPASLRWVISTSAGAQRHVCEQFYERFRIPVSQAYGIIEYGLPLIHSRPDPNLMDSVGTVTPGYEVGIFDSEGNELPDGVEGRMAIRGQGRFEAYLVPWKPAGSDWFYTGDWAVRDEQGRYFIKGREKSMVNLSGLKVFPEEVEEVLLQIPEIRGCKVYGLADGRGEEELIADIVVFSELDENTIKQFLRKHLALYKVPRKINMVSEIQETFSGKIKR